MLLQLRTPEHMELKTLMGDPAAIPDEGRLAQLATVLAY